MKKIILLCAGFFAITPKINAQACPIIPFAVVELFTTQGCSYCPAAGDALDSIIFYEKNSGRNVICIAEHVSYNGYGWTDPYNDPQFYNRQYNYCLYTGTSALGTPQAFINGKRLINATSIPTIQNEINQELGAGNAATASVCLTLQSSPLAPTLAVGYKVTGNYSGAHIVVCLVEDSLITTPTNGENIGVTLEEDGVSRKFVSTAISGTTGTVNITPPANCIRANSRIVAYVQNPTSMYIRGATTGIELGPLLTGIESNEQKSKIYVYPNPAKDVINVSLNNSKNYIVTINDLSGRMIYSEYIYGSSSNAIKSIDLTDFSKGMYILTVSGDEKNSFNQKIIVE